MSYVRPTSVAVTAGPTGTILDRAALSAYLGEAAPEDSPQAGVLDRILAAAQDIVEEWTGASFRQRTIQVTVTVRAGLPVWLPWGNGSNYVAEIDGVRVPDAQMMVYPRYDNVAFIEFEQSGECVITYEVGRTPIPAVAGVAVSRVAAAMYDDRDGSGVEDLRRDVMGMLSEYASKSDWS